MTTKAVSATAAIEGEFVGKGAVALKKKACVRQVRCDHTLLFSFFGAQPAFLRRCVDQQLYNELVDFGPIGKCYIVGWSVAIGALGSSSVELRLRGYLEGED